MSWSDPINCWPINCLVRSVAHAYIRFGLENPELLKLMFDQRLAHRDTYPEQESAAAKPFDLLVSAIRECQIANEIGPGEPNEIAMFAWSTVHGFTLLSVNRQWADKGFDKDVNALIESVTSQMYLGLRGID